MSCIIILTPKVLKTGCINNFAHDVIGHKKHQDKRCWPGLSIQRGFFYKLHPNYEASIHFTRFLKYHCWQWGAIEDFWVANVVALLCTCTCKIKADNRLLLQSPDVEVLYHSDLSFRERLYGPLDVDLCRIKLHEPLSVIVQQPLLYVRDMVPKPCFEALVKLDEVRVTQYNHSVYLNCLDWPNPPKCWRCHLINILLNFWFIYQNCVWSLYDTLWRIMP